MDEKGRGKERLDERVRGKEKKKEMSSKRGTERVTKNLGLIKMVWNKIFNEFDRLKKGNKL